MQFLYPFCNLSETFDNADITHEDALNIIINNEDNYPTFDLEGLIFRYNIFLFEISNVLFEFHLKFWNTTSIGIPARSLL